MKRLANGLVSSFRRNPWWIPVFLGRVPDGVDDRSLRLLGAVALALFFEEYDLAMLTSALKHIAGDLDMPQERLGLYLAVIRMGAIPAFFLIPFADRLGRRRVFIFCVTAMGLVTFATGFARSPVQFVVCQAATRAFFVSGSAVAFVIVTEEFPAEHRGWGLGMLAALGIIGHGAGAALFSQIDRLPYGWRFLYFVGVIPVLLLPYFRARVPETGRFARLDKERADRGETPLSSPLAPLASLARKHPARAAGVALTGFVSAVATLPAFQFSGYFVLGKHQWSPGQYSVMVLVAGAFGIVGNIAAGRLGDRFGRKLVGAVLLSAFPMAAWLFYRGPAWALYPGWVFMVFGSQGGRVILRALATELFPTDHRGSATGLYTVLETLGAATGFMLVFSASTRSFDDLSRVIPVVSASILIASVVLFTFPETRKKELEEID